VVVQAHPRLSGAIALGLLACGQFGAVEAHLRDAEAGLAGATATQPGDAAVQLTDRSPVETIAAEVAAMRTLFANLREDTAGARVLAQQALDILTPDHMLAAFALYNRGAADWLEGNMAAAVRNLQTARERCLQSSNRYTHLLTLAYLAQVRLLQGCLREAVALYEEAQRLTPPIAGRLHPRGNGLYVGLGALQYEQNELDAAATSIMTGIDLARAEGNALVLGGGLLVLARVRQAQGAADAARSLAAEGATLLAQHGISWLWVTGPVDAYQARLALVDGDLPRAAAWAQAAPRPGQPTVLAEAVQLARARVWLAENRPNAAEGLLRTVLGNAEGSGRVGHVIEALTLLALARDAQGDRVGALALLEGALRLAAPEGYVRTFVDLGAPLRVLAEALPARNGLATYLPRLLAVCPDQDVVQRASAPVNVVPSVASQSGALDEPLTAREIEILTLVAAGLSNREIADQLIMTVGTVKWYLNQVYGKLAVSGRMPAVARARALGMIA
jgi:LuxR family maltose regulon positive regulatory protein